EGVLRLDNGELIGPKKRKGPTLTADYLPHKPKRSLTYDRAVFPPHSGFKTTAVVVREGWYERENGRPEAATTHRGVMKLEDLLLPREHARWLSGLEKRRVLLPALPFQRRAQAGFIEIGHPRAGKKGDMTWEPVLKVGTRPGDTWDWTGPEDTKAYKL